MYQNWNRITIDINPDGTLTAKAEGVEKHPITDSQDDPVEITGNPVQPSCPPSALAAFQSAIEGMAQAAATAYDSRVRLNGSDTEYVKAVG